VAQNHFFRGRTDDFPGDQVYFQGHAAPGMYARAFMEGRLDQSQLQNFRQELADGGGLSSYPHPYLMPEFWQFPTVSMGLGPINSIYQARFMRYLENRGLIPPTPRRVWGFLGDGEMDEPESMGSLTLASREKLDNLTFVIHCNLQRLDALLARDSTGLLQKRMGEAVDGEYQTYITKDGAYIRKNFFGKYPELLDLVAHLTDDELMKLRRGGHDPRKVYNAYKTAVETTDRPTVILAHTIKGKGVSFMEDRLEWHYKSPDDAQLALALAEIGEL